MREHRAPVPPAPVHHPGQVVRPQRLVELLLRREWPREVPPRLVVRHRRVHPRVVARASQRAGDGVFTAPVPVLVLVLVCGCGPGDGAQLPEEPPEVPHDGRHLRVVHLVDAVAEHVARDPGGDKVGVGGVDDEVQRPRHAHVGVRGGELERAALVPQRLRVPQPPRLEVQPERQPLHVEARGTPVHAPARGCKGPVRPDAQARREPEPHGRE